MNRILLSVLLAASAYGQAPPAANSITHVLSEDQVRQLEALVAADPSDAASRALLGKNYAYFILGVTELGEWDRVLQVDRAKAASEFAAHARQQLAESGSADVCGEGGYTLWNASFDVEGSLAAGRRNMERIQADRVLAALAVDRAIALEPAAGKWHGYRAHSLVVRTRFDAGPRLRADEAFRLIGQDMAALNGVARDALLPTAARLAMDAQAPGEAGAYAREMIEKARSTRHWHRGNLVFYGNTVLGQLALRDGDRALAAEYLLAAGKTSGSPQLNSFGPNMSLAKEFIEAGYKEPVRQFFDECSLFWRLDRGRLKSWAAQMDSGQMPNFGANLVY